MSNRVKTNIIIKSQKEALVIARSDKPGLVLWLDGLKLGHGYTGAAVCWKEGKQWKEKSFFLGKM